MTVPQPHDAKALHFVASGLSRPVKLLLTFQPLTEADHNMCWKVISFPNIGNASALVKYTGYIAFISPQVDSPTGLVQAATSSLCNPGQTCSLISTPGGNAVTPGKNPDIAISSDGAPTNIRTCVNETLEAADIAVGLSDSKGANAEPCLLWKDVGPSTRVQVDFKPTLRVYESISVVGEVIFAEKLSGELWTGNLQALSDTTTFLVEINPENDQVVITVKKP